MELDVYGDKLEAHRVDAPENPDSKVSFLSVVE